MNFFPDFILAVRSYFSAFRFLKTHKLWYLLVIPSIFNVLAFIFVIYLSWIYTGDLIEYFLSVMGIEAESSWLVLIQFLIALVVRAIVILLFIKLFRYIVLIFFAPMLAFVAEKVYSVSTGNNRPFNVVQFTRDIYRGMTIAVRNLFFELLITAIILLLASIIPPLALIAPFVIFVVESYFYGFAMVDYRNECLLLTARESRILINKHTGLAVGNGAVFNTSLLIPFFGVMFMPVLAVVAGSLAMNEIKEN